MEELCWVEPTSVRSVTRRRVWLFFSFLLFFLQPRQFPLPSTSFSLLYSCPFNSLTSCHFTHSKSSLSFVCRSQPFFLLFLTIFVFYWRGENVFLETKEIECDRIGSCWFFSPIDWIEDETQSQWDRVKGQSGFGCSILWPISVDRGRRNVSIQLFFFVTVRYGHNPISGWISKSIRLLVCCR